MFTKEIATALGCDPKNINDVEITETTVDSRSVTDPASALFFALRGVNHDGHDYIPALYARGCRNFVVGAWRVEFDALTGANFSACWMCARRCKALRHGAVPAFGRMWLPSRAATARPL